MFHRTDRGLSNLHIFYAVDAVAYVEGGQTHYTEAQISSGAGTEHGLDIKFWNGLFAIFKPQKKVKFLAIGGKPYLQKLAAQVIGSRIANVYVCMDRDLDTFLESLITHPSVFYTHGYSWENDVWTPDVIEDVYYAITPVIPEGTIRNNIQNSLRKLHQQIAPIIKSEILVRIHGMDSIIGNGTGGIVETDLTVNRVRIRQILASAKAKRNRTIVAPSLFNFSVEYDCRGHIIAYIGQTMIRNLHWASQRSQPQATSVVLDSIAIDKFLHRLGVRRMNHSVVTHYQSRFDAI